ncbi:MULTISPECIES: hypothetical protein [Pseudomonas]|uniref:hypothetical protein n=1 Tax=unclassified Pseudomonas TaxID=196821 RepID=UPI000EFCFF64|nr:MULTISPECIES: hypothetical protein [unclassified Pseudomonas]AYN93062.1 hypothetical protein EAW52_03265 [Pseudomonas sp. LTJR-52]
MIRLAAFSVLSCLMLAGCAGATSDKACRAFSPPPVSVATPTGQNDERIATTTGASDQTTSADGCR